MGTGFKPSEAKIEESPIWVVLLELSIEMYDINMLKKIGNILGKLISIDTKTRESNAVRFSKMYIQMKIDEKPPRWVRIGKVR